MAAMGDVSGWDRAYYVVQAYEYIAVDMKVNVEKGHVSSDVIKRINLIFQTSGHSILFLVTDLVTKLRSEIPHLYSSIVVSNENEIIAIRLIYKEAVVDEGHI